MKNIISSLYHGKLCDSKKPLSDGLTLLETATFRMAEKELIDSFDDNQKLLFSSLKEFNEKILNNKLEQVYALGFKTGLSLALETLKTEP